MTRVHLISHTPIDAAGGVPRFNRYLQRVLEEVGHEVKHWSAWDLPVGMRNGTEWGVAKLLSRYLDHRREVSRDDVIIGDGFWCGDFALMGYRRVISTAHGIWSHRTKDDIDRGLTVENPHHHAAQVDHRRQHLAKGLPIVAVSLFIRNQMKLQWGFDSQVINNAIDPSEVPPYRIHDWWRGLEDLPCNRPVVIVHGINDRGNVNKGWDHVQACRRLLDNPASFPDAPQRWPLKMMLLSLDEFHELTGYENKMETMAAADACLIPSGYEGNSYFALEAMNCDVPVVAYDVGLFDEIWGTYGKTEVGVIMNRRRRDPTFTAYGLLDLLTSGKLFSPRDVVQRVASFDEFRSEWCGIVDRICRSSSESTTTR